MLNNGTTVEAHRATFRIQRTPVTLPRAVELPSNARAKDDPNPALEQLAAKLGLSR